METYSSILKRFSNTLDIAMWIMDSDTSRRLSQSRTSRPANRPTRMSAQLPKLRHRLKTWLPWGPFNDFHDKSKIGVHHCLAPIGSIGEKSGMTELSSIVAKRKCPIRRPNHPYTVGHGPNSFGSILHEHHRAYEIAQDVKISCKSVFRLPDHQDIF